MFENMILRPFEKIRMIRTQYHMTQQDLAGTTISRQLIGYIEKGQNDLSQETAIKIEKNLKEYFKNKGIEDPGVTAKLLLESDDIQIIRIVKKYNEDLTYAKRISSTNLFIKVYEDIKEIYLKYKSKIRSAEFLGIIKILCESTLYLGKWEEAKGYILIGIDKSNSLNLYYEVVIYYTWMTVVDVNLREYEGVIPIYNHVSRLYENFELKDDETFTKISINTGIAYRKSNMNIECVQCLSKVRFITKEPSYLFNIYNLIGKSLLVLKQYDEAERNLLKALEFAKSITSNNNASDLCVVLENLSMLYLETERKNEAVEYIERIDQVIDSITNDYQRAINLYYLTIIEIIRDSKGTVKSLCSKVMNLAAELKDKLLLYRISYEVCKYLHSINDSDGLEQLADNIYKISIDNDLIHERIPNVIYFIAEYFEENKNNKKTEIIRKKISKYAYELERQICHQESFEI